MRRIDVAYVRQQLCGQHLCGPIIFRERITSTNDEAAALAAAGADEGTIVIADEQTAGRGRRGRRWLSTPGHSLLFSIILRPPLAKARWPELVSVVAVGVAEGCMAVADCPVRLKWPNDLIVEGRKIGGILIESVLSRSSVIAGVGLNVNGKAEDFPSEIQDTAGTLEMFARKPLSREALLLAVLVAIDQYYGAWLRGQTEKLWTRRRELETTLGQERTFVVANKGFSGIVRDIQPEGLILEKDGRLYTIAMAEIL